MSETAKLANMTNGSSVMKEEEKSDSAAQSVVGSINDFNAAKFVFEQLLLSSQFASPNDGNIRLKNTFLEVNDSEVPNSNLNRSITCPAQIDNDEPFVFTGDPAKDAFALVTRMMSIAEDDSETGSVYASLLGIETPTVPSMEKQASVSSTYLPAPRLSSAPSPTIPVARTESVTILEDFSTYTTVMLRNIPNKYTQSALLEKVNHRGFRGSYDFFYLPVDFKNGCNVGYAFLNFVTHEAAVQFMNAFRGYQLPAKSCKVCDVCWARVQGLARNVEHYRNSPVNDLPDPSFKPLIFDQGVSLPFPGPNNSNNNGYSKKRNSSNNNAPVFTTTTTHDSNSDHLSSYAHHHINNIGLKSPGSTSTTTTTPTMSSNLLLHNTTTTTHHESILNFPQTTMTTSLPCKASATPYKEAMIATSANAAVNNNSKRKTNNNKKGSTASTAASEAASLAKVFVGGLSADTTCEDLTAHFAQFGTIADVAIVTDKKTGASRGFGFCNFVSIESAELVMSIRQHIIKGQSVGVRLYSNAPTPAAAAAVNTPATTPAATATA